MAPTIKNKGETFRESDEKEHRRGSQQRHQHTVKHKLRAIGFEQD
jgi:hypothetical protein